MKPARGTLGFAGVALVLLAFHARAQPLPDLILWAPAANPSIATQSFSSNSCEVAEGCVQPGTRRLLKFSTETRNIGAADLVLGNPVGNPLFDYDPCHGHYHFAEFADYRLLNSNGVVTAGGKIGFCLLDLQRWDTNASAGPIYDCGYQGIQKGWADVYSSSLPCQWIDLTGVPAGAYTLEMEVNPAQRVTEADYSNNVAAVQVIVPSCRAISLNQIEAVDDGNGDDTIDPGEVISEIVVVQNLGCAASNVTATLATTVPGVTLLQAASAYPGLADGGTATNLSLFQYLVAKAVACGTLIPFSHVTTCDGESYTNTFVRVVGRPESDATNTFTSADVPRAIADLSTVYSSNVVSLPPGVIVDDVNVSVRLNHTYTGDLVIALGHPDGTEAVLIDRRGGAGNNLGTGANSCAATTYTVFDDEAGPSIAVGVAPFNGSFRPETALSVLDGRPAAGAWRLRISDEAGGDTGTLGCWHLTLVSRAPEYLCTPFNHPPVASNRSYMVMADSSIVFALTGSDLDEDPLNFFTNGPPVQGLLSGFNPATGQITYTPAHGFSGPDCFQFVVGDGTTNSATATVDLMVVSPPDANTNGLPDAWETAHSVSDPAADPDGDGFTNLREYLADTDPKSATSVLRITDLTELPAGHFQLLWSSVGGVRYRVQYQDGDTNGPAGASFIQLVRPLSREMDPAPPGTPSTMSFVDDFTLTSGPPPQGQRYYRVEVVR
jgi:subtilisin-like proprotein convertase family protein